MRIASLCLFIGALATPAHAQLPLSGDMDQNGEYNAPDVVLLNNTLADPITPEGMAAVIADANQDGKLDSSDTEHDVDVILGILDPLPLNGGDYTGLPMTFWIPPSPPPLEDVHAGFLPAVSFNASPE